MRSVADGDRRRRWETALVQVLQMSSLGSLQRWSCRVPRPGPAAVGTVARASSSSAVECFSYPLDGVMLPVFDFYPVLRPAPIGPIGTL